MSNYVGFIQLERKLNMHESTELDVLLHGTCIQIATGDDIQGTLKYSGGNPEPTLLELLGYLVKNRIAAYGVLEHEGTQFIMLGYRIKKRQDGEIIDIT